MRRGRRLAVAVLAAALAAGASGCAPATTPDPALVLLVQDALSATRTAQLDLGLVVDDRVLGTSSDVVLSDMAEALATTGQELELHLAAAPADDAYRDEALDAVRDALGGIRVAREGDAAEGLRRVDDAADVLAALDAEGGES